MVKVLVKYGTNSIDGMLPDVLSHLTRFASPFSVHHGDCFASIGRYVSLCGDDCSASIGRYVSLREDDCIVLCQSESISLEDYRPCSQSHLVHHWSTSSQFPDTWLVTPLSHTASRLLAVPHTASRLLAVLMTSSHFSFCSSRRVWSRRRRRSWRWPRMLDPATWREEGASTWTSRRPLLWCILF